MLMFERVFPFHDCSVVGPPWQTPHCNLVTDNPSTSNSIVVSLKRPSRVKEFQHYLAPWWGGAATVNARAEAKRLAGSGPWVSIPFARAPSGFLFPCRALTQHLQTRSVVPYLSAPMITDYPFTTVWILSCQLQGKV